MESVEVQVRGSVGRGGRRGEGDGEEKGAKTLMIPDTSTCHFLAPPKSKCWWEK